MKRLSGVILVLALSFIPAVSESAAAAKWVRLFNGKDLTGWQKNGTETWTVQDGAIMGESTTNKYGYLTTEKTYKDFDLRLKFKSLALGNSGVFIRSHITGIDPEHGPDIEGMQVEVDPSVGKDTAGLYESGGRGWVIKPTAEGEKALKQGEWNDLKISARGNRIITWLNGVQIVDYTDPAPKFTEGVIGLQLHTGGGVKMLFKDIEIQPM